jgi:hypothetical protein
MFPENNKKISLQSKSFLVLFLVALFGTYLIYVYDKKSDTKIRQDQVKQISPSDKNIKLDSPEKIVDTSSWQTYKNEKLGVSFKMPSTWKVKNAKSIGSFSVFEIDPGKNYYNILIYQSPKGFYATEGLPIKQENINGLEAININNMLYGIKTTDTYFTFDLGISLKLKDEFKALVHTVELAQK